jgi:hypothetical protein
VLVILQFPRTGRDPSLKQHEIRLPFKVLTKSAAPGPNPRRGVAAGVEILVEVPQVVRDLAGTVLADEPVGIVSLLRMV